MAAKKKQTEQEVKLKVLICDMIEELGDSRIKGFFSRMNSCGISTSDILYAIGYPTWCLLLESSDKKGGKETPIKVFDPNTEAVHSHATLSQVIGYDTTLVAPTT